VGLRCVALPPGRMRLPRTHEAPSPPRRHTDSGEGCDGGPPGQSLFGIHPCTSPWSLSSSQGRQNRLVCGRGESKGDDGCLSQVYVMDSEGGASTRLTFLGADTATVVRIVPPPFLLSALCAEYQNHLTQVAALVRCDGPSALSPFLVTGHTHIVAVRLWSRGR
jgi:hypothetical protein